VNFFCYDENGPQGPAAARYFFSQLVAWWQGNQAVRQLAHLPDAQLRDIGVERRDIDTLVYRNLTRLRSWSARL
jgi:uncharacterized protein YjiS (DUF1127 family)